MSKWANSMIAYYAESIRVNTFELLDSDSLTEGMECGKVAHQVEMAFIEAIHQADRCRNGETTISLEEYHNFIESRLFYITSQTLGQHFQDFFYEKGQRDLVFYEKQMDIYREKNDGKAFNMIKQMVEKE